MKIVSKEQRWKNFKFSTLMFGSATYLGLMIGLAGTGNPIGYIMAIVLVIALYICTILFGKD